MKDSEAISEFVQNSTLFRSACADNSTSEGDNEDDDENLGWTGSEVSWVLTSFFIGYTFFQVNKMGLLFFLNNLVLASWW